MSTTFDSVFATGAGLLNDTQKEAIFNEAFGDALARNRNNITDVVVLLRVKGADLEHYPADTEGRLKAAAEGDIPAVIANILDGIEDDSDWEKVTLLPTGCKAKPAFAPVCEFTKKKLESVSGVNFRTGTIDKIFFVFAKTAAGSTKKA
ncbi:hypothetical protein FWC63_00310 [Candidatus Saccharibacteria bacterium]|nr:hypothetical protein [Candidatus Saccharibacteria bacterium]